MLFFEVKFHPYSKLFTSYGNQISGTNVIFLIFFTISSMRVYLSMQSQL
jgi:hypothetical protein